MKLLRITVILISSLILLYILTLFSFGFPFPRGNKVNNNYYTYYKNFIGIYYISIEHPINLINHGHWGYLKDVDETTFSVLSDNLAKDASHVWFQNQLIPNIDAKTFHLNSSGVAIDKNHVYIFDFLDYNLPLKASNSGIDSKTAEYFIFRLGEKQTEWMRDKNHVYLNDQKTNVDRNSFKIIDEDWFIDKDFVYITKYNPQTEQFDLCCIDSIQQPIEPGYMYFRNGKNIIYQDHVILRDIDIHRFEEIGVGKYIINNMIFLHGKPFLKDSLNVENAKFYFHGHIIADNENVFFRNNRLDDIDAATFHQIDDETFEDKHYIYTITDYTWKKDYPFDKKKK